MRRRDLLRGVGIAAGTAATGCLGGGGLETRSARVPPVVEDRPDAVYVPTHVESMEMVGASESAGQKLALSYTFPHRFWTTQAGQGTKRVDVRPDDSVHMMALVWYPDSEVFVTDAAPNIQIRKDGQTVADNNPWAMLSQPMGFHFGDNLQLGGEGTYTVTVETSAPTTTRTGTLSEKSGRGRFEFEFEYSKDTLRGLSYERFRDRKGTRGAAKPRKMSTPLSVAPAPESLPGESVGEATSGDARFLVRRLDDATRFGGAGSDAYLAVSPRTPYNGYVVPQMALKATLKRGGETVFEGPLSATLDPDLDFHYGATLGGLESGDELVVEVQSPPQVARHEGYETAFLEMDSMTVTV